MCGFWYLSPFVIQDHCFPDISSGQPAFEFIWCVQHLFKFHVEGNIENFGGRTQSSKNLQFSLIIRIKIGRSE